MAARDEWYEPPAVEFYVDFETVSSLDDDFSTFPARGGQDLIFMIGCGHIEDGEWRFECFTADTLTEPDEAKIIDAWFEHMGAVRDRLAPDVDPQVIHWSHAEVSWLEEAHYAAVKRHPEKDWPHPNWFDFLMRVVREEPVVVRGAHGFGLKPSPKAMHALGLVESVWGDGPLVPDLGDWLEQTNAANRAECTLATRDSVGDLESMALVDCGGQNTGLILTASYIGTRTVSIVFQFVQQDDLQHFTRLSESLAVCDQQGYLAD
jgi:hypothetical protein